MSREGQILNPISERVVLFVYITIIWLLALAVFSLQEIAQNTGPTSHLVETISSVTLFPLFILIMGIPLYFMYLGLEYLKVIGGYPTESDQ